MDSQDHSASEALANITEVSHVIATKSLMKNRREDLWALHMCILWRSLS